MFKQPVEQYELIMDENKNAFQRLPKAFRFQMMLFLSIMWSTIFCLAIGSWFWWGELVIGHVAIVMGIFITGFTFSAAQRRSNSHRDLYRANDGTARYDDLWGG